MIRLVEVNEENWLAVRALTVEDSQKGFLDSALGILARGYVYRDCRARVIGIADDDTMVGVALVRDLDEEPAPRSIRASPSLSGRCSSRWAATSAS